MKKLIGENKKRFQTRKDCDYLSDLLEIGISEYEAWNHILWLNQNMYFYDFKPDYLENNKALIFKKIINGEMAYIKLKIEKTIDGDEEVVCLSFHVDR